jgi:hypothetical protein
MDSFNVETRKAVGNLWMRLRDDSVQGRDVNTSCEKLARVPGCTRGPLFGTFAIFGRLKIRKLLILRAVSGFDSVPGHHVFNNLQTSPKPVWFYLVPKINLANRVRLKPTTQ